jgi:leucyl aminopeptidase
MDFPVKVAAPVSQTTACAIIPVFDGAPLPAVTRAFDKASGGLLSALRRSGDIKGDLGNVVLLHKVKGTRAKSLLVVGCGPRKRYARKALRAATLAATRKIAGTAADAINYLSLELPSDCDTAAGARVIVDATRNASYGFSELKSEKQPEIKLKRMGLAAAKPDATDTKRGASLGQAIANGVEIARNLGNRPANVCTPSHIGTVAKEIARQHTKLSTKVLTEKDIARLKMGSFLSVTQGATEPPRLIVMQYNGGKKGARPIALCGKGVTFDTGGISIKPAPKMDEMKFDMCGAAGVIGTMAAIAEAQIELNVVAVVPCCENMPSGTATRPGDVVTSMSGKTIEVLNTDAEGRLILCDAMTYAQQEFDPICLLDVATLTGACVVALGQYYTGVFSNDDALRDELVEAGKRAIDGAWPMPADTEYGESLRSNFADFANIGQREGGASVAASFLHRFVDEGRDWAHLDIAGVAWRADANKGATGRPVGLLVDFLMSRVQ